MMVHLGFGKAFYMVLLPVSFWVSTSIASELELLINCGAGHFLNVNSNSVVLAKFNQKVAKAQFQFKTAGSLTYENAVNDAGTNADGAALNLKLTKLLWNFSSSDLIEANSIGVKSAELSLRADLLDHLLLLNARLLDLKLGLIEKAVIDAQVKELEDLGRFADRLMRSRVIDPADALLVKENLIRFQLRQLEVDESLNNSLTSLAVDSGIPREKFKLEDRLSTGASLASSMNKVDSEFQVAKNRLRQLTLRISELPRTRAAAVNQTGLQRETLATERTWYPSLLAEGGVRRSFAPIGDTVGTFEGFAGLALSFELPAQLISADLERLGALRRIELEKEKRSEFDSRNVLNSKLDQIGFLHKQFKTSVQRRENLERLLDLQLIKFKSGKLSFLNVNDVMLSLLEARRQAGSSRARILAIENDAQIILAVLDQKDFSKRSCE